MRRVIRHALAAVVLLGGCASKKPVSTHDGVEYLRVRPESLDDSRRRASYDRRHVELIALVDDQGYVWHRATPMFTLANGVFPSTLLKQTNDFQMTRLWGTYHDAASIEERSTFSVDGREVIDTPPPRTVTLAEVDTDFKAFDGCHVVMEGDYRIGHEASWLDGKVWVQTRTSRDTDDQDPGKSGHLRIQGWLSTRSGRFGHLGRGRYLLHAENSTVIP